MSEKSLISAFVTQPETNGRLYTTPGFRNATLNYFSGASIGQLGFIVRGYGGKQIDRVRLVWAKVASAAETGRAYNHPNRVNGEIITLSEGPRNGTDPVALSTPNNLEYNRWYVVEILSYYEGEMTETGAGNSIITTVPVYTGIQAVRAGVYAPPVGYQVPTENRFYATSVYNNSVNGGAEYQTGTPTVYALPVDGPDTDYEENINSKPGVIPKPLVESLETGAADQWLAAFDNVPDNQWYKLMVDWTDSNNVYRRTMCTFYYFVDVANPITVAQDDALTSYAAAAVNGSRDFTQDVLFDGFHHPLTPHGDELESFSVVYRYVGVDVVTESFVPGYDLRSEPDSVEVPLSSFATYPGGLDRYRAVVPFDNANFWNSATVHYQVIGKRTTDQAWEKLTEVRIYKHPIEVDEKIVGVSRENKEQTPTVTGRIANTGYVVPALLGGNTIAECKLAWLEFTDGAEWASYTGNVWVTAGRQESAGLSRYPINGLEYYPSPIEDAEAGKYYVMQFRMVMSNGQVRYATSTKVAMRDLGDVNQPQDDLLVTGPAVINPANDTAFGTLIHDDATPYGDELQDFFIVRIDEDDYTNGLTDLRGKPTTLIRPCNEAATDDQGTLWWQSTNWTDTRSGKTYYYQALGQRWSTDPTPVLEWEKLGDVRSFYAINTAQGGELGEGIAFENQVNTCWVVAPLLNGAVDNSNFVSYDAWAAPYDPNDTGLVKDRAGAIVGEGFPVQSGSVYVPGGRFTPGLLTENTTYILQIRGNRADGSVSYSGITASILHTRYQDVPTQAQDDVVLTLAPRLFTGGGPEAYMDNVYNSFYMHGVHTAMSVHGDELDTFSFLVLQGNHLGATDLRNEGLPEEIPAVEFTVIDDDATLRSAAKTNGSQGEIYSFQILGKHTGIGAEWEKLGAVEVYALPTQQTVPRDDTVTTVSADNTNQPSTYYRQRFNLAYVSGTPHGDELDDLRFIVAPGGYSPEVNLKGKPGWFYTDKAYPTNGQADGDDGRYEQYTKEGDLIIGNTYSVQAYGRRLADQPWETGGDTLTFRAEYVGTVAQDDEVETREAYMVSGAYESIPNRRFTQDIIVVGHWIAGTPSGDDLTNFGFYVTEEPMQAGDRIPDAATVYETHAAAVNNNGGFSKTLRDKAPLTTYYYQAFGTFDGTGSEYDSYEKHGAVLNITTQPAPPVEILAAATVATDVTNDDVVLNGALENIAARNLSVTYHWRWGVEYDAATDTITAGTDSASETVTVNSLSTVQVSKSLVDQLQPATAYVFRLIVEGYVDA